MEKYRRGDYVSAKVGAEGKYGATREGILCGPKLLLLKCYDGKVYNVVEVYGKAWVWTEEKQKFLDDWRKSDVAPAIKEKNADVYHLVLNSGLSSNIIIRSYSLIQNASEVAFELNLKLVEVKKQAIEQPSGTWCYLNIDGVKYQIVPDKARFKVMSTYLDKQIPVKVIWD